MFYPLILVLLYHKTMFDCLMFVPNITSVVFPKMNNFYNNT